ncbi:hypothetical protein DYY67_0354 [Candidatus Nitrosotalea sp. TS]|nr:hypothetical protein [Candidatus Nitrosotalea sp. TS]
MIKLALIGSILLVASDFGMVVAEAFAIGGGLEMHYLPSLAI